MDKLFNFIGVFAYFSLEQNKVITVTNFTNQFITCVTTVGLQKTQRFKDPLYRVRDILELLLSG